MSKRNSELLINDIRESAEKIQHYTHGYTFEKFISDDKTLDAVIRNFEIIGEAANRLPDDYKELHPTINWHRIRGFRNRIVHDYAGIDYEIVWNIIQEYLPVLISQINKL